MTFAIISIGEMGHACARLFTRRGARVITVLDGRSERTRALAQDAGVLAVENMGTLVGSADIILSLVTPSSALSVAEQIARSLKGRPRRVLIDANSTSPMLAEEIERLITAAGGRFVDGAVIGSAAHVGGSTALYLSGPGADDFKMIEQYGLKVNVLGDKIGQASTLKIFNAGLNKGIAALLVELLLGASRAGVLEEVVERYNEGFHEIVKKMDGFLAGLPLHARRRSEEMTELQETLIHLGITPTMTVAVHKLLSEIALLGLDPIHPAPDAYRRLLETLAQKEFLSPHSSH